MSHEQPSLDPVGILDGAAEALPYEPSEDDKRIVEGVKRLFRRAYDHKLSTEREMDFWRRYVKGEQHHLFRDRETGDVVRLVPRDAKRLYSLNNQLRPTVRSLVGKMTSAIPTFSTVPPTMDQVEVAGARVADAYFEYFRRKEGLDVLFGDLCEDAAIFGTGCVQLEWDPTAGRVLAYCEACNGSFPKDLAGQNCPTCEAQLAEAASAQLEQGLVQESMTGIPGLGLEQVPELHAEIPILEEANEGDVTVRVRDPRDIFVEPGPVDPKELRWLVYRSIEPVSEIRRRFPEMGRFVGPSRSELDTWNSRYTEGEATTDYLDEHVTLYEYHELGTELHPEGRIIWVAEDVVLKEIASPYAKFGRLPFFFFRWTVNRGEFWGEAFVAQAWHRQKELNAVETVTREHMELLVRPKVLDPIGSRITTDEFTATTGQRIKYNAAAGKPEFWQPPDLPIGVFNRRVELIEDIRGQAGVTAQEAGANAADPNGRAMAIIEAEADRQLGPITKRNTTEWAAMHRCLLQLVQDFYSPERKFTVAGEDSYADTYSFADLNISPGWDIQLEVEDGLSKNQAMRLTQSLELMNAGVFMDPTTGMPDVRKFVRTAKVKVPGIGPDLVSPEYAAALESLRKIENGDPIEPKPYDDAPVFAEVFLNWLRTKGRRSNPDIEMQVTQAWQFYTMWALSGQPPMQAGLPEQNQGSSDQTAPGGTPNNPGMLGTGLAQGQSSLMSEAGNQIQYADQVAEQQAQVQTQHEG